MLCGLRVAAAELGDLCVKLDNRKTELDLERPIVSTCGTETVLAQSNRA